MDGNLENVASEVSCHRLGAVHHDESVPLVDVDGTRELASKLPERGSVRIEYFGDPFREIFDMRHHVAVAGRHEDHAGRMSARSVAVRVLSTQIGESQPEWPAVEDGELLQTLTLGVENEVAESLVCGSRESTVDERDRPREAKIGMFSELSRPLARRHPVLECHLLHLAGNVSAVQTPSEIDAALCRSIVEPEDGDAEYHLKDLVSPGLPPIVSYAHLDKLRPDGRRPRPVSRRSASS